MQCRLTWSSKRKIVLSQERDPSRLLKDFDWRVAYCCCQVDGRGGLVVTSESATWRWTPEYGSDPERNKLDQELNIVGIDPMNWRVAYYFCQIDRRRSLAYAAARRMSKIFTASEMPSSSSIQNVRSGGINE